MNRRRFLKWLGIGAASASVLPAVAKTVSPMAANNAPMIDRYNDFMNLSELAISDDPGIAGWVKYRFYYTVTLPPERTGLIAKLGPVIDEY